ncbi:MAG: oligosaccharide flippase family protein [Eubacteriales bacterium]
MKNIFKHEKLQSKMGKDIAWNMASMIFVAIAGLVYNTIFVVFYTADVFGLYNQALVYFLIFSQIAVFGIHFSVLKYAAEYSEEEEKRNQLFSTAILSTLITSVLTVGLIYGLARLYILWLGPSVVVNMLIYSLPALVFFALNKVILNYLNAIRAMRAFAVFQSLRYVLIVLTLLVFGFLNAKTEILMLIYAISEFLLFVTMVIYVASMKLVHLRFNLEWIKEHIAFGSKVFLGSVVVDLNAKMDIVVLGLFVSDAIVGFYSFAIMFADGFYQILVVLRRNINPLITQYTKDNMPSFHQMKNSWRKRMRVFSPVLAAMVLLGYWALCVVLGRQEYLAAILPFAIVLFGKSFNGYYIVMGNLMNQTGNPKQETWLNILTIGSNTLLNFLLIPHFGMNGAAVATAVSFFVFRFVLHSMAKNRLNINLLLHE